MFINKKWMILIALVAVSAMILVACTPPATPEVIIKEVPVEKEVIKEVEVVVTATPVPPTADLSTECHLVQCHHPGETVKEVPVGQHEPVDTGDEINTDDNGLGILTFADFLRVEIFRQTGLQVKAVPDPDAPPIVKLYLAFGTTLQELQKRAGERVDVTTETAWATIRSGTTKYLVSVDENEITSVIVYEGEAEVEAQQQTVTVGPGQATWVEPGKAPQPPIDADMEAVDDWVREARQPEEEGAATSEPIPTPTLPVGDVEVQLYWWTTADLDLHVVDPDGNEIYWDNRIVPSGGQLERDANGFCEDLSTNPMEYVYWPPGGAPAGEYWVAVVYEIECRDEGSVEFRLVVEVDSDTIYDDQHTLDPEEYYFEYYFTR
jgi:hypothetical protein